MFPSRIFLLGCCLLGGIASQAAGHGLPIYVAVKPIATGSEKLEVIVSQGFDSGELTSHPVFNLSADLPSFGVLNANQGVLPGDQLGVRIVQEVLYWNGSMLDETLAILTVNSAETTDNYLVTASSALQEGLIWASYPASAPSFWDADGLYQISADSPAGVYGVVVQVTLHREDAAIDPVDSVPFVLPFLLNGTLNDPARDALQEAISVFPVGDFDRDWQVDDTDLSIWQSDYGLATSASRLQGDADGDSDVDGNDFLLWQRSVEIPSSLTAASKVSIPEPGAFTLVAFAALCWTTRRSKRLNLSPDFHIQPCS